MSAVTISPKEKIQALATADNVHAHYSGREKTMFIGGNEARVKAFLRKMNLKGKAYVPFALKQGIITQG
jgi:hypothetical protein